LTTGSLAVHRHGPLADALRASVSIPGLLPPVMFDGEAHVDGGMMNWLPVDVMSSESGTTIAVDVASDSALHPIGYGASPSVWRLLRRGRTSWPIVDLLVRTATVGGEAVAKAAREHADILFTPPLETVDLLDWQACDRAIEAGYRHAIEKLAHVDISALQGASAARCLPWSKACVQTSWSP
jgi:NTE family protein